MRDVSYSDPLPSHTSLPANGSRKTLAASRLVVVRHGACGFPAETYVARGTGRGLRLDLPAPLFAHFHLAAPPRRLARYPALSRYVVLLQTLQPLLAPVDQAPSRACRLAPARRANPPPSHPIPERTGGRRNCKPARREHHHGRRLIAQDAENRPTASAAWWGGPPGPRPTSSSARSTVVQTEQAGRGRPARLRRAALLCGREPIRESDLLLSHWIVSF